MEKGKGPQTFWFIYIFRLICMSKPRSKYVCKQGIQTKRVITRLRDYELNKGD